MQHRVSRAAMLDRCCGAMVLPNDIACATSWPFLHYGYAISGNFLKAALERAGIFIHAFLFAI
jgi:hypothetical protein